MIFEPVALPQQLCTLFSDALAVTSDTQSKAGKVIFERLFMFEPRACILCALPAHNPDTASKDFSRSLLAQGKFQGVQGRRMGGHPGMN